MASFNSVEFKCCVCFDDLSESQVLQCPDKHSMCVSCLERSIKVNKIDGSLSCVSPNCKKQYGFSECHDKPFLISIAEKAYGSLESWRKSVTNLQEQLTIKERAEQEVSLVKSLESLEKSIRIAVEESMVTRCPKCGQAFIDFEGCLSLKCSNCSSYFCGLCLKLDKTNQESHQHITDVHEGPEGLNGFFDMHDARNTEGPGRAYKKFENLRIQDRLNGVIGECAEKFSIIFQNVSKIIGNPQVTPTSVKNMFVKKVNFITTGENDELESLCKELQTVKTVNESLKNRLKDATERTERLERRAKDYRDAYGTLRQEYDRVIELFDEPQNKAVPSHVPDPKAAEEVVIEKQEELDLVKAEDQKVVNDLVRNVEPVRGGAIVRKIRWCKKGSHCEFHNKFKLYARLGKGGAQPCWYLHTGDKESTGQINPYDERPYFRRGEGGGLR